MFWKCWNTMSNNRARPVLICYDISSPRRLAKTYRFLCGVAIPVQYSVFIAYLKVHEISLLITQLKERINEHQDDVRVYSLPDKPEILNLGESWLSEGVMLLMRGENISTYGQLELPYCED